MARPPVERTQTSGDCEDRLADDGRWSKRRGVAREHAVARFSGFKVGAALETADGLIITGCNIENATYGLTLCAERVAMFKALSEGHRRFTRVAVVADTASPTPPCGACRQILWEFGGDLEVVLANLDGVNGRYRLRDLLPLPFDARAARDRGDSQRTDHSIRSDLSARATCYNSQRMLPTIEWQGDAVVMVDQRKLPAQGALRHAAGPPTKWPRRSRPW